MPLPFSRGFAGRMALAGADAWMDKLTSRFSLENASFSEGEENRHLRLVHGSSEHQEDIWSYSEEAEYGQIQRTACFRYVSACSTTARHNAGCLFYSSSSSSSLFPLFSLFSHLISVQTCGDRLPRLFGLFG